MTVNCYANREVRVLLNCQVALVLLFESLGALKVLFVLFDALGFQYGRFFNATSA